MLGEGKKRERENLRTQARQGISEDPRHLKSQAEMENEAQGVVINLMQEIQLDVEREKRSGQGGS